MAQAASLLLRIVSLPWEVSFHYGGAMRRLPASSPAVARSIGSCGITCQQRPAFGRPSHMARRALRGAEAPVRPWGKQGSASPPSVGSVVANSLWVRLRHPRVQLLTKRESQYSPKSLQHVPRYPQYRGYPGRLAH